MLPYHYAPGGDLLRSPLEETTQGLGKSPPRTSRGHIRSPLILLLKPLLISDPGKRRQLTASFSTTPLIRCGLDGHEGGILVSGGFMGLGIVSAGVLMGRTTAP